MVCEPCFGITCTQLAQWMGFRKWTKWTCPVGDGRKLVSSDAAFSTGRRNDLRELLQWCHIAECLARPSIEASLNASEVGR